jgi:hypothetical protein
MTLTGFKSNSSVVPNRQRNDCTIRALMEVTGVSYEIVAHTLALYGKKDHRGFRIYSWLKDCNHVAFGKRFIPNSSLARNGRFLLGNKGHCWAIINGEMRDYTGSRASRFLHCYLVVPAYAEEDHDPTATMVATAKRIHDAILED